MAKKTSQSSAGKDKPDGGLIPMNNLLTMNSVDPANLPTNKEMSDCLLFMAQSMMTVRQNLLHMENAQKDRQMLPNTMSSASDLPNPRSNDEDVDESDNKRISNFKIPVIKKEVTDEVEDAEIDPLTCTVCGKRFKNQILLKKHHTIHSGNKPFKCELCDKTFSRKDNMRRHLRQTHMKVGVKTEPSEPTVASNVDTANSIARLLALLTSTRGNSEPACEESKQKNNVLETIDINKEVAEDS